MRARAICNVTRALLACGIVLAVAAAAQAQSITGVGVTNASSANELQDQAAGNSFQRKSDVQVTGTTTTSFTSRYRFMTAADWGLTGEGTETLSSSYTITFTVTAPGAYLLNVAHNIAGAVTLISESSGDARGTHSAVTGGQTGGTVASGSLGLTGAFDTGDDGDGANVVIDRSGSAVISGTSNGVAKTHTLTFSWSQSCKSRYQFPSIAGGDECAVRGGLTADYGGETASDYGGVGSRNINTDGHFVSVTLTSLCGNGTTDSGNGEACDQGAANGTAASCCTSTCQFRAGGQQCRAANGLCDQAESCTGAAATCPADSFLTSGQCRGSAGDCDVAESCNGSGPNCPADGFASSSTVCRGSAGDCDVAESCTGSGPTCPANAFVPSSTVCRSVNGDCDVAESCTGSSAACPADGFASSSTQCRAANGACDVAESCTGSSRTCPANGFATAGTGCRSANGVCDVAESCTGASAACPADAFAAAPSNFASGATTSQSSTDVGASSRAVDGNTNGAFAGGSVARTSAETEAWWEVDLGAVQNVGLIELWNTSDGSEATQTELYVFVSDFPFTSTSVADSLAQAGVSAYFLPGQAGRPSVIDVGRSGRYVRVQLTGDDALALAEVRVVTGTVCRGAVGVCDADDLCDGSGSSCPAADVKQATECRGADGACDVAESCDGVTNDCPADLFVAGGTECRGTAGACDVAESCTGSDADCPADDLADAGTECRGATGACDLAEACTGSDVDCPADLVSTAGTECRAATGACDVAEACDGSAKACPGDVVASASTECRASAGDCDVAESCDGSDKDCPADVLASSATVCRSSAGACDVAESCSGSSATCPTDGFVGAGTECRASAGACDVAETCTGATAACPADAVVAAGTECRAQSGACDVAESCDGSSTACPVDAVASAGTECRAGAGDCDVAESCDGSSNGCPADAFKPSSAVCRPSAGDCDTAESCTGSSAACPADGFVGAGATCRAASGVCDVAESCTGSAAACPADAVVSAGTECRPAAGICDVAEACDGVATSCPVDVQSSDGDNDGTCDAIDNCVDDANGTQADSDGDGVGDACDPCTNTGGSNAAKQRITVTKVKLPTGDDKLTMRGQVTIPLVPAVDPVANGVRVILEDVDGAVLDVVIAGGAYDKLTKTGWRANTRATRWTYKNGSPTPANPLQVITLSTSPRTPGLFKYSLRGKNGALPLGVADVPLKGTLVIDSPSAATGQCAEAIFGVGRCKFNRSLVTVTCK